MIRKCCFLLLALLSFALVGAQDDALNLPTELYVLTNSGFVQQYGLGLAGLSTVTPEDEFISDVGAAPDGNWLAYRTEAGLNLLNMYTGETIEVEGATAGIPPVRGRGDTIAWSPAGDAIAYTTAGGARIYFIAGNSFLDLPQGQLAQLIWSPGGDFLAAEADQNIWWLFRRENTNLVLHSAIPSAADVVWESNSQLLFTPTDGGLIRMDLGAANAQTVLLDNTWVYRLPYPMGDGSILVFGRQKADDRVAEGSGQLLTLPPGTAETQPLSEAAIELNGLRWAPGGQLLIAFRGGVMAAVIPASGQGLTLPVADAVAYTWGAPPLEKATALNLPYNGYFIADGVEGIKQVWWLPADGSLPQMITEAASNVTAFAMSPDELGVVYADSAGLWLKALNGGEATSLEAVNGDDLQDLAFNLTGTMLVFTTSEGVWLRGMNGGTAELKAANDTASGTVYSEPQFAPNLDALMVKKTVAGSTTFEVLQTTSVGEPLAKVQSDDAQWLGDGRILAIGEGTIQTGQLQPQKISVFNLADSLRTELMSLPFPIRVENATTLQDGRVRLVLGGLRRGPQAWNVVNMDVTSGALAPAGSGGFMLAPIPSPDGTVLAGMTRPGGSLTLRDVSTGRQIMLLDPPGVAAFQWGTG